MLLRKQLEFVFERSTIHQCAGRDVDLELKAREILYAVGAARLAGLVRVEWNPRLKTAAGRADSREKLISLNPRLSDYGEIEIDRTLRHELAHLVAQFRGGRRRILKGLFVFQNRRQRPISIPRRPPADRIFIINNFSPPAPPVPPTVKVALTTHARPREKISGISP